MLRHLPNLLTVSRILGIPLLVGTFYLSGDLANWLALGLFIVIGLTDFLDGYLARALKATSAFGRFLDPVADKLLVAAALLMMVAFRRIDGLAVLPAVVILCREILVSGLREYLAERQVVLPVIHLAKWKTATQLVAIGFLLVGDAGPDAIPVVTIGDALLWIAGVLSVRTGHVYLRIGLRHMTKDETAAKENGR